VCVGIFATHLVIAKLLWRRKCSVMPNALVKTFQPRTHKSSVYMADDLHWREHICKGRNQRHSHHHHACGRRADHVRIYKGKHHRECADLPNKFGCILWPHRGHRGDRLRLERSCVRLLRYHCQRLRTGVRVLDHSIVHSAPSFASASSCAAAPREAATSPSASTAPSTTEGCAVLCRDPATGLSQLQQPVF
jgi:hypothetical protein